MRISAVIPVYNREGVIGRSLSSVLAQTRPLDEILVVDDGSTDGTCAAALVTAAGAPNVRIVATAGRLGAAGARNFGVAAATGDAVAFLDSDDEWLPDKLEKQLAVLASHPGAPAVCSNYTYRFRRRPSRVSACPALVTHHDLLFRNRLGTSTSIVRKDAFLKVGGFSRELPCCEDWDLWLRLSELGDIPVLGAPLTNYYFDGGGRLSSSERNVIGHQMVFQAICAGITNPDLKRQVQAEHQACLAEIFSRQTFEPVRALRAAIGAVSLSPGRRSVRQLFRTVGLLMSYGLT